LILFPQLNATKDLPSDINWVGESERVAGVKDEEGSAEQGQEAQLR
jgi:hypothetical protein